MNIIDKLRAIVAACDQRSRGMLAITILMLSRQWERLTKDNERMAYELESERRERNRLQRQVNALICNGFQFEARGISRPGQRVVDSAALNWQRGLTTGRIIDAAKSAMEMPPMPYKDYMTHSMDCPPFEDALKWNEPRTSDVIYEVSQMMTAALVPHILAAVCEARGTGDLALKIREHLARDRKEFCR